MPFSGLYFVVVGLVLLAVAALLITVVVQNFLKYRGDRLVTCPETKAPAAVHVNAIRAAGAAVLGKADVRLDQCSRWPERQGCGQECLSQISADPAQCLVWNIVDQWYRGKSCAYCQQPFKAIHWHDRPPAMLEPDHSLKQWNEIPPEQLPKVFATNLPVCWNCFVAETFRRKNPDRVVDRKWDRGPGGEYVPKQESPEPPATQAAKAK